MIHLYNSLTRKKELLRPLTKNQLGLYVCGLTVYDECHLGHGRLFIWFDTMVRYLRHSGYQVTYVRNITDIDDKIINRAKKLQIDWKELTEKIIDSMHQDEDRLNIVLPDFEPRVTNHMAEILELINILISKGFAYKTKNGDVYYEVKKFKNYGELAHRDLNSLETKARIENNPDKRDPLDFVLWKSAKPEEPSWPSPWGMGRPGWHIECSAMAKKYLGNTIDIHGGGSDLQFPHHQNELAQSEAANGSKLANYWMHMGFVEVSNEKMSKSLGNHLNLKQIMTDYHPEVLRYFILTSHYRSSVNFSHENMENSEAALRKLYISIRDLVISTPKDKSELVETNSKYYEEFCQAMDDDFNTPKAVTVLFEMAKIINQSRTAGKLAEAVSLAKLFKNLAGILGLLQTDPNLFLKHGTDHETIECLITKRNEARHYKNWSEADRIRDHLGSIGIAVEDGKNGTTWFLEDSIKYKNLNIKT